MTRGRTAALPPGDYEPPARLLVDGGQCAVMFVPEDSRGEHARFDFSQLPLPASFQLALAEGFERHTGPAGRIKSVRSARQAWRLTRRFSVFLSGLEPAPAVPSELRPRHLSEFLVALGPRPTAPMDLGVLRSFLLNVEGLTPAVQAKCAEWIPNRRAQMGSRSSYTAEEEKAILDTARNVVRQAARRIRAARHLIEQSRAGTAGTGEEHGRLLGIIEATGDVPKTMIHRRMRPEPWTREYGTSDELCRSVFPGLSEISALLLLLVRLTGENGATIARAPAVHHRPDAGTGAIAAAQVDLDKPRRGNKRYMTATFADLPPWACPPAGDSGPSARDELHTPFGAYMLAIELTGPARRITGHPELLQYWRPKGQGGRGFGVASEDHVSEWGRTLNLTASVQPGAGPRAERVRLEVGTGRMRTTFMARERRPAAHTEQTHLSTYLRRDRTTLDEYRAVVADALAEEVAKARKIGSIPRLTPDDIAEAAVNPETVASRHGVTPAALGQLISQDADTALAGCSDNTHGPFSEPGEACRASFLKCLECPCARALPHHLPVQVAAHDALAEARAAMPALRWAQRFALPQAQLSDLLEQAGEAAVTRARASVTTEHQSIVTRLLGRELDLP